MSGVIAVLIEASFFLAYVEQRELYRTLAECEMRVLQFNNESRNHRGYCTIRTRLTDEDVAVYGGFKKWQP